MSLRKAINDHCKWCIHDREAPGNWRQQVTACQITRCALWPHRPKSKGKVDSGPDLAPQADTGPDADAEIAA